jgi:translation initiation factor 2 beta subunit (eIF-2beta)/eIF-5
MRLTPAVPAQDACPTCGNPEPTGWQFNCDTMMAECDKCGVQLPTWLHVL